MTCNAPAALHNKIIELPSVVQLDVDPMGIHLHFWAKRPKEPFGNRDACHPMPNFDVARKPPDTSGTPRDDKPAKTLKNLLTSTA
jgi:hypothetical protein